MRSSLDSMLNHKHAVRSYAILGTGALGGFYGVHTPQRAMYRQLKFFDAYNRSDKAIPALAH